MDDAKLSREDVESLLNGGRGGPRSSQTRSSSQPVPKVRVLAYDFRRPERVV